MFYVFFQCCFKNVLMEFLVVFKKLQWSIIKDVLMIFAGCSNYLQNIVSFRSCCTSRNFFFFCMAPALSCLCGISLNICLRLKRASYGSQNVWNFGFYIIVLTSLEWEQNKSFYHQNLKAFLKRGLRNKRWSNFWLCTLYKQVPNTRPA